MDTLVRPTARPNTTTTPTARQAHVEQSAAPHLQIPAPAALVRELVLHAHAQPMQLADLGRGERGPRVAGAPCGERGDGGARIAAGGERDAVRALPPIDTVLRTGRDRVERVEPDASLTPSDFQRMRR